MELRLSPPATVVLIDVAAPTKLLSVTGGALVLIISKIPGATRKSAEIVIKPIRR
jgi:hypothetical protein